MERDTAAAEQDLANFRATANGAGKDKEPPRKLTNTITKFRRWAKLWQKCDAKLCLRGVITPSGTATAPREQAAALTSHWGKVFAKAPIDTELAGAMTRVFSDAFPWARVQLPGRHSVLALLDKVKDSGVGPDGIPYSAWAAGGEEGAETLKLITWWMMATGSAPESFNESIACFIPKPIDEEAELHCRSPNDVRPLSLNKFRQHDMC